MRINTIILFFSFVTMAFHDVIPHYHDHNVSHDNKQIDHFHHHDEPGQIHHHHHHDHDHHPESPDAPSGHNEHDGKEEHPSHQHFNGNEECLLARLSLNDLTPDYPELMALFTIQNTDLVSGFTPKKLNVLRCPLIVKSVSALRFIKLKAPPKYC